DKGTFQKWYESKGFNRGKVYQYINKYKVFNNIEDPIKKDIFINAPTSLQNEMSVGVSNLASNIEKSRQRLDGNIDSENEIQLSVERAIESLKDQIILLDELRKDDVIEINECIKYESTISCEL